MICPQLLGVDAYLQGEHAKLRHEFVDSKVVPEYAALTAAIKPWNNLAKRLKPRKRSRSMRSKRFHRWRVRQKERTDRPTGVLTLAQMYDGVVA